MQNSAIKMVERFGNVCFWIGLVGAPITFLWVYADQMDRYSDSEQYERAIIVGSILSAICVWLAGAAVRYILTGRGLWKSES